MALFSFSRQWVKVRHKISFHFLLNLVSILPHIDDDYKKKRAIRVGKEDHYSLLIFLYLFLLVKIVKEKSE